MSRVVPEFQGARKKMRRMERRWLAPAIALAGVLCAAGQAQVVSGRSVGEITPSFAVLDVTGPYRGKPICYVCEYKGAPTVIAFFRDTGDETANLLVMLNELAQRQPALKMIAAIIAGPERKPWLETLAEEKGIRIPLVVFRKGKDDVAMKLYKLNSEARNTVLVAVNRKVSANLANVTAQDFAALTEAVSRVLAAAPARPPFE